MKKHEDEYLIYYLDQLSCNLKNNIAETQLALQHISEISKYIDQKTLSMKSISAASPIRPNTLDSKPDGCLIRIKEVCMLIGVSRSTIYRMIDDGLFPKPLDLGPRFKAWQKSTVTGWIKSRIDY